MQDLPKISVLIPCYNAEKYIVECISSIQNQSYKNIEIIVVDDGSTDESATLVQVICHADARVRYYYQENKGLPGARNSGLDLATGEYISFVDNDDILHENFLYILYKNLISSESDISVCEFENFIENPRSILDDSFNNLQVYSQKKCWQLINENVRFVVMWNKLYKRTIFDDLRFTLGKYHEDESIVHYIYHKIHKVVKTDAVLYAYRNVPTSMVRINFTAHRFYDLISSYDDRLNFYEKNRLPYCDSVQMSKWNFIYYYGVRRHHSRTAKKYLLIHPMAFFKWLRLPLFNKLKLYTEILLWYGYTAIYKGTHNRNLQ